MLRILIATLVLASSSLLAAPPVSDIDRHYTREQWNVINSRFIDMKPTSESSLATRDRQRSFPLVYWRDGSMHLKTLLSTGNRELDATATAGLRHWRAKPGVAGTLTSQSRLRCCGNDICATNMSNQALQPMATVRLPRAKPMNIYSSTRRD